MVVAQLDVSSPLDEREVDRTAANDVLPWADPYIVRLLSSHCADGEPARGPRSPLGVHRPDVRTASDANGADRGTRDRPRWDGRSSPA